MRDRWDKTAFDIALDHGKRDVGNFLAKRQGNLGTLLGDPVRSTSLEAESQNSFPGIEVVEPPGSRGETDEVETNNEQSTSLHSALKTGNIIAIKRLLDRGANVNERDEYLHTPLFEASSAGKLEIARTLINYGGDVNCRSIIGWSPLHIAALSGHIDIARLLLDNGADMNAAQRNYQTPLHLASVNEHHEVVLLLLERGANVQVRNVYGRTPSQEASIRGYWKIVKSFSEYVV
ncbi:Ankyrin repeat-containing domain protein [Lactarius tabidus]